MKELQKTEKPGHLTLFGLFILGLEFILIILALSGIFYAYLIAAVSAIGISILGFFMIRNLRIKNVGLAAWSAILLCLLASVVYAWNPSPTVFSGRDQGSFSEAAIRLSENHQLKFKTPVSQEFFKIYGPGTALNFPGFNYTKDGYLTTHFSIGYISWLAGFYSVFGLLGFSIANALAFFLFLLSFYSLSRIYLKPAASFLGLILILTSFVFNWLPKITLGENLALGLLWFSIFEAALFFRNKKRSDILISILAILILSFTRLESWAFLAMMILILAFKSKSLAEMKNIFKNRYFLTGIALIAMAIIASLKINSAFYVSSLKGLLRSFAPQTEGSGFLLSIANLWKILSSYAIFEFILIGTVGIYHLIREKKYETLIPAMIVLPSAIYLFHPGISPDHPWMLRRFAFSVIPAAILYSTILLDSILKKRAYFYAASFFLLSTNLLITFPYFQFTENKTLLSQAGSFSQDFSDSDLILLDRETTGNGWSMISGPMNFIFQKQAVYFFNPKDLSRIDTSRFARVFLVVPDKNTQSYADYPEMKGFSFQKDYAFTTSSFETAGNPSDLPQIGQEMTYGKIYLLNKDNNQTD